MHGVRSRGRRMSRGLRVSGCIWCVRAPLLLLAVRAALCTLPSSLSFLLHACTYNASLSLTHVFRPLSLSLQSP